MKKLTIQALYESIMENQVPTTDEMNDEYPETEQEVIHLLSEYWLAIDEIANIKRRIRKIAQEKNNRSKVMIDHRV